MNRILAGFAVVVTLVGAGRAMALQQATGSGAGAQPPRGGDSASMAKAHADAERQFREELDKLVRERLHLSDETMAKLRSVSDHYQTARGEVFGKSRKVGEALKKETAREDSADQQVISNLLDQMFDLQQQAMHLGLDEQKELAKILTPLQRAKYMALQQELFRMMRERRRHDEPPKTDAPAKTGGPPEACGT